MKVEKPAEETVLELQQESKGSESASVHQMFFIV